MMRSPIIAAAAFLILSASAVAASPEQQRQDPGTRLDPPRRFFAEDLSLPRYLPRTGTVRARIVLRTDPVVAEASGGPWERAAARMTPRELVAVRAGAGSGLSRVQEHRREATLFKLRNATARAIAVQAPILRLLRESGARVEEREIVGNSVTADLPVAALRGLAGHPVVAAVDLAPRELPQGLETSSAAVGASSMWAAGYTGGRGPADRSPIDLAILSDKIQEDHPAFAGIAFQRPSDTGSGTPCGSGFGDCDHGAGVASMAVSRGAAGCALCVPADDAKKGIAPGLDSVLDADVANVSASDEAWALGIETFGVAGAADPAEVMSNSRGSFIPGREDGSDLQIVDKLVSTFGVLLAKPSGNDGPSQSFYSTCIAYDTLCMGAIDMRETADPSDDFVEDFSSRGPTPGGRKKPDLVAVGDSEVANRRWQWDGRLWRADTGTSYAAPQGAGAAALLAGSGISDPLAQKAILINSARHGRATPTSAMGTQTGWQPDWGWGALDLSGALNERTHIDATSVAGGGARFYRSSGVGPGDRATLVWNRRAVGCIRPGCGTTALTLTNLNLQQLNPATGAVQAHSSSAIDNVEQVRAPGGTTADVIYKVKATTSVDGLSGEPYAVASRRPLVPLATPEPTTELTLDASAARPGEPVVVQARIANPSADLTAENARVTLELPAGARLAPGSGAVTQAVGTLSGRGTSGDSAGVSWSVIGDTDGLKALVARSEASRYGETFATTQSKDLLVDGIPPAVGLSAPAGATREYDLRIGWWAVDAGTGTKSFQVEVARNGGPFQPWLTSSREESAIYQADAGGRYRFRVRAVDRLGNTSSFVTSEEVTVVGSDAVPPPATPVVTKASPRLRLTRATLRGSRLVVEGRIDARATRRIRLAWRARAGARSAWRRLSVRPGAGRFKVVIRLSRHERRARRLTVTADYPGDVRLRAGRVAMRLLNAPR